jgi:iron complex transport system ATP-binding protein
MAVLETTDLSVVVAGKTLCAGLDLACYEGENWVVLGANGAGKTTLLHTLAGLKPPIHGQVTLAGRDLYTLAARERARKLGILLQDYDASFPATVMETVLTGRHPHLEPFRWEGADDITRAKAALTAVGLAGLGHRLVTTLSGGERRRVEIATLLVQDTPVCLLDEPINHLDLRHQSEALNLLAARASAPQSLNVFVLHDVNLATRFCSHALLLFGNGEHMHGPLHDTLQRESLERLYRCRLREIKNGGDRVFLPA